MSGITYYVERITELAAAELARNTIYVLRTTYNVSKPEVLHV